MERTTTNRSGFTIVELLVVIGIIAVLLGLLLPSLTSVTAMSRASASMSNLRQWGIGTLMYTNLNRDTLPWEGFKDKMTIPNNAEQSSWWANAVPPLVDQPGYREFVDLYRDSDKPIPLPHNEARNSIFIDPGAVAPNEAPYMVTQPGSGLQWPFFFCYVPNAQLNNTREEEMYQSLLNRGYHPNQAKGLASIRSTMRLSMISRSEATILMVEKRTIRDELPASDPFYGRTLDRHRADWKRFAARHFRGGHMLFADGHVEHVTNERATRPIDQEGMEIPQDNWDDLTTDWNKPDLIWDPLGPALN